MEWKWFYIMLAVVAMSVAAVEIVNDNSPGAVARADAVKACVEQGKHNMFNCARLK